MQDLFYIINRSKEIRLIRLWPAVPGLHTIPAAKARKESDALDIPAKVARSQNKTLAKL